MILKDRQYREVYIKKLLFTQSNEVENISDKDTPFLLMDYEGPIRFSDEHSNITKNLSIKNQDTITVIYSCNLEENTHRNNRLSDDDLAWMKSDCGILQDGNSDKFKLGNTFQLWLCLPKGTNQLENKDLIKLPVPLIQLPDDAGKVRVVVGTFRGNNGPIEADSLDFWDMRLNPGHTITIDEMENQNVALFVISGEIIFEDGKKLGEAELGIFAHEGNSFTITTTAFTKVVLLSGPPIDEPIMGYGHFDLNTLNKLRPE